MDEKTKQQIVETIAMGMGSFKKEHSDLLGSMMSEMKEFRNELKEDNKSLQETLKLHTESDTEQFQNIHLEIQSIQKDIAPFKWTLLEVGKAIVSWVVPAGIMYFIFKK